MALYLGAVRELGVAQFGRASILIGVVAVATVLADSGSSSQASRDVAQSRGDLSVATGVWWRLLILVALSPVLLAVYLGALFGPLDLTIAGYAVMVIVWAWVQSVEYLIGGVLMGMGRVIPSVSVLLTDRCASIIVFAGLSTAGMRGASSLCLSLLAGCGAGTVVFLPMLWTAFAAGFNVPWRIALRGLRTTWGFLAGGVGAQLQNLDVAVVGLVAGSSAAGLLAAPSRLTTPLGVAAASSATILLSQARFVEGHVEAWLHLRRIIILVFVITIVGTSPLWLFPELTIREIFGTSYLPGTGSFRLIAVGTCIAAVNQPLAAHLQAHSRQREVGIIVLIGGAIGLVLVALLAQSYGAVGGGIAIVVTQSFVLGFFLRAAMQLRLAHEEDFLTASKQMEFSMINTELRSM